MYITLSADGKLGDLIFTLIWVTKSSRVFRRVHFRRDLSRLCVGMATNEKCNKNYTRQHLRLLSTADLCSLSIIYKSR